jgi:cytochrome c
MRMTKSVLKLASPVMVLALLSACSGGADKSEEASAPAADASAAATNEAAPAAAAPATAVTYASLTGVEANGDKVFKQCMACHSIKEGENRVGPSLHGIIGRTAGQVAGFSYSTANKSSGKIWNEDTIFTYLEAPQKFIPGTKMAFVGLKNPQDRADVIAFLKTHD